MGEARGVPDIENHHDPRYPGLSLVAFREGEPKVLLGGVSVGRVDEAGVASELFLVTHSDKSGYIAFRLLKELVGMAIEIEKNRLLTRAAGMARTSNGIKSMKLRVWSGAIPILRSAYASGFEPKGVENVDGTEFVNMTIGLTRPIRDPPPGYFQMYREEFLERYDPARIVDKERVEEGSQQTLLPPPSYHTHVLHEPEEDKGSIGKTTVGKPDESKTSTKTTRDAEPSARVSVADLPPGPTVKSFVAPFLARPVSSGTPLPPTPHTPTLHAPGVDKASVDKTADGEPDETAILTKTPRNAEPSASAWLRTFLLALLTRASLGLP